MQLYGTLNLGGGGTLNYQTLQMHSGTLNGTLQNRGAFIYSGGDVAARVINDGVIQFGPAMTIGNGLQNDTTMSVSGTQALTLNGQGLDNLGTFNLNGGTLNGAATQTNDYGATLNAAGSITAPLLNNGAMNVTGLLTLSNTFTNAGVTTVPGGGAGLRLTNLTNYGAMNVNGSLILNGPANNAGVITLGPGAGVGGTGALVNGPGGLVQGSGGVSAPLTNSGGNISATSATPLILSNFTGGNVNGGQMNVGPGGVLQVLTPFTNSAVITLGGAGASLGGGGSISNTGTIKGAGSVSNLVLNGTGVVRAEGGTLLLSAASNTNGPNGQIQAPTGATLFYSAGLPANAGVIALSGGAFDNNNQPLTNANLIAGNGVLRTGGLLNSGTVILSDLASQVYGAVTNNGSLKVVSNTTTFYGPITNNGTLKTTAATARFLAPFINNGVYSSDPSEQSFTDLTVGPAGALVGGAGDRFTLTGDFRSSSARPAVWQTDRAALEFAAGGPSASHVMDVQGADGGGYAGNFAWGDVVVDAGQSLTLADGDAAPGGALYVRVLEIGGVGGGDIGGTVASLLVNADPLDPVNVYYDPAQPANAYLGGDTYALGNGGFLIPAAESSTPEPAGVALLSLAAAGLLGRRRRLATL